MGREVGGILCPREGLYTFGNPVVEYRSIQLTLCDLILTGQPHRRRCRAPVDREEDNSRV